MAGGLGTFLSRATEPPGEAGSGVELVTGTVLSWTAGSRTVDVFGTVQTVKYAADIVGGISSGDVVAILRARGDHLVICKVADA